MRLHRFYVGNEAGSPIGQASKILVEEERLIHQWRNVFRYNVGSEIIVFDGSGMEYDGLIEKINNREAQVGIISERQGIVPERKIILHQSLIKKDKMEWLVEKATEIGVSKIVPVISERSEKKDLNIGRTITIAIEASEQCGRANVPEVNQVTSLELCLAEYYGDAVVLNPSGSVFSEFHSTSNPLSIFVGPEGGWSPKEVELFENKKVRTLSLGPLTLRSETAALAALAAINTLV